MNGAIGKHCEAILEPPHNQCVDITRVCLTRNYSDLPGISNGIKVDCRALISFVGNPTGPVCAIYFETV